MIAEQKNKLTVAQQRTFDKIALAKQVFQKYANSNVNATFIPLGSAFRLSREFDKMPSSTYEKSDAEFIVLVEKPGVHKLHSEIISGQEINFVEMSTDLFKSDFAAKKSAWIRLLPLTVNANQIQGKRAREMRYLFKETNQQSIERALGFFKQKNPGLKIVNAGQLTDLILRKLITLNEMASFEKRKRLSISKTIAGNIEIELARMTNQVKPTTASPFKKLYKIPDYIKPRKAFFEPVKGLLAFYAGKGAYGKQGRFARVAKEYFGYQVKPKLFKKKMP